MIQKDPAMMKKVIRSFFVLLVFYLGMHSCKDESPTEAGPSSIFNTWGRVYNGIPITLELRTDHVFQCNYDSDPDIDVRGTFDLNDDQITFIDSVDTAHVNPGIYNYDIKKFESQNKTL